MMTISIKPHHFVDIITRFGEGRPAFEPHPLGHALHTVTGEILASRTVMLRMEFGADDICSPCSQNINGICHDVIDISTRPQAPASKLEYNLLLDQRWAERLDLHQGQTLSAVEFCERLRDREASIVDIYRESPVEGTLEREAKLRQGVAKFLEQESI